METTPALVLDAHLSSLNAAAFFLTLALWSSCGEWTYNLKCSLFVDLNNCALLRTEDHLKDLCLSSSDHLRLESSDEELGL